MWSLEQLLLSRESAILHPMSSCQPRRLVRRLRVLQAETLESKQGHVEINLEPLVLNPHDKIPVEKPMQKQSCFQKSGSKKRHGPSLLEACSPQTLEAMLP